MSPRKAAASLAPQTSQRQPPKGSGGPSLPEAPLERIPELKLQLAALLKQARADAGVPQSKVARAMHKPQSYISKAELAKYSMTVVDVAILARLYAKPFEFFDPMKGRDRARRSRKRRGP